MVFIYKKIIANFAYRLNQFLLSFRLFNKPFIQQFLNNIKKLLQREGTLPPDKPLAS